MKLIFRLLTVSIITLAVLPNRVCGQKKWTLQECVEYALKNNLSVKQGEINVAIAEANREQSLFSFFPTLSGSASYSNNSGRSVDAFTNTYTTRTNRSASFSINSNVTLFSGLQLQNQLKQNNLNYQSSRYDLDKIRNDISLNIAAAYLQAVYAREEMQNAAARRRLAEDQLERTRKLVENDLSPQGNLLEAEAQVANEEFTRISALNAYQSAVLSLTQLMNLENSDDFEPEEPRMDVPKQESMMLTVEAIYKEALGKQPEIRSAELKTQSAYHGWKISTGSRLPRINLFGSISTLYSNQATRLKGTPLFLGFLPNGQQTASGDVVLAPSYQYEFEKTPFRTQIDNNLSKSFGLSVNIPVFSGRNTEMAIKRSRLNYESSRLNYLQTQNQLYKNIQQAHQDALAALNKYEASKKSAEALKEAMMYIEKKYEAGLVTALDYNTARNNLTRAESAMLQSKYDFIFRIKVLDFYAGKPLVY